MSKWESMEKAQEELQKLIARRKRTAKFMQNELKDGEVYDPLKEIVISIQEAPITTLNRIQKSINSMYKSSEPSDTKTRETLLKKKKEIELEIAKRGTI